MLLEMERWKPTVQVRADAISMSGWKALMSSPRPGLTAIGYVGLAGNDAGYRRCVSLSSTGQDSPGGTRPVFASRVRLSVLPGLGPKIPVNAPNPCRS